MTWSWSHKGYQLEKLPIPQLPLMNASTALMALGSAHLDISDVNIVNGLKKATLPGRMQHLPSSPLTILDVAHNPHSAQYLVSQLTARFANKCFHVVVGMLHDKDVVETLNAISPIADQWYLASLEGPRAASAQELSQSLKEPVSKALFDSPVLAYQAAMAQANQNDVVLVLGSFHTVGEVLEYCQSLEA
jgi:dihydrofolate synthase/folylpolyglutamate synthase